MARRRKRRSEDEHENLERWLVSYADFITLLFAFFVVMYAISSVNEGKYRVLSETLNAAFTVPPRSEDPIQVGETPRDVLALPEGPLAARQVNLETGGAAQGESDPGIEPGPATERRLGRAEARAANLQRISDEIAISLQAYIDQGLVNINPSGTRLEIEMKDRMLFPSGTARLSRDALDALRALSESLKRIPSHLQVEGHTDDIPISTAAFPSNWELSAARAASVVHFLARSGVEPWRMSAVGLGEHRPIAENDDARGRAANRRVTIVVLTGQRDATPPELDHDVPWAEGPAMGP
jgi:chemotaxis protein MotB